MLKTSLIRFVIFAGIFGGIIYSQEVLSHEAMEQKFLVPGVMGFPPSMGPGQVCVGGSAPGCKDGKVYSEEGGLFMLTAETNAILGQVPLALQELQHLKPLLDATIETQNLLKTQIIAFNDQLMKTINKKFDQLPQELLASDAIKQLRLQILEEVDQKIKDHQHQ